MYFNDLENDWENYDNITKISSQSKLIKRIHIYVLWERKLNVIYNTVKWL